MSETKTLQMIFLNAGGGKVTLNLADPREDLIGSEVETAMQSIITENALDSSGGDLIAADSARIVVRQVNELEF